MVCSFNSEPRTTSPAMCVEGSAENAVAATKGKKINAPSQTASDRSIRKRRKFMQKW